MTMPSSAEAREVNFPYKNRGNSPLGCDGFAVGERCGTFGGRRLLRHRVLEMRSTMRALRYGLMSVLAVLAMGLTTSRTLADGFIVINQPVASINVPPWHFPFAPLEV